MASDLAGDGTAEVVAVGANGGWPRSIALIENENAGAVLAGNGAGVVLKTLASARGIALYEIPQGSLPDRLTEALASNPDLVVVAGGDGTVACAAQALVSSGTALGLIPAGTMNLLAKDLGIPIDDREAAARLFCEGARRDIDVGELDGHVFLCALMFGTPAGLGRHREHGRQRGNGVVAWMRFARAAVRALLRHRARRMVVIVDGMRHTVRTASLTVTVNALDDDAGRIFSRSTLEGGRLSVYVVRHRSIGSVLHVILSLVRGRVAADPAVMVLHGRTVEIDCGTQALHVLVDGEERLLQTPLRARILPGALRIMAARR